MKKQIAGVVFSLLISAEVFYGAQADQGDDLCKLGIQAYEQEKYEEAINYLAQASEMGNAEAQDVLGECYFNGYGIRSNPEKAAELFQQAADQDYAKAYLHLSDCYYYGFGRGVAHQQSYEKAMELLKKGAELGDAETQYALGLRYFGSGMTTEQDYKKAAKWLKKSAEQGYAPAQCYIGECYSFGLGVEKSMKKAAEWYLKAAKQDDYGAMYVLSGFYEDGRGVSKDSQKAVEFLQTSAEGGWITSQVELGRRYLQGKGVEYSTEQALKWFQKAADRGDPEGRMEIGRYYYVIEQDYEKAFAYFEEFAQEGNARSMIVVAYMYQYGIGTQKDADCAKKWIQKASNLGDQMATLILEGKVSISDNSVIQQTLQ